MPELLLAFRRVTFLLGQMLQRLTRRRRWERCQRLLHFPLTLLHLFLEPPRPASPTTSSAVAIPGILLRLSTSICPALFSNELEYWLSI
jgi:hypothetical protein